MSRASPPRIPGAGSLRPLSFHLCFLSRSESGPGRPAPSLYFSLCFLSRSESAPDDLRPLSISLSVSSVFLNRALETTSARREVLARGFLPRAATANSHAHAALPRARFQPRISPRGARLDENRRLARLGDDSRRHTRELTGALDATVFFPPG